MFYLWDLDFTVVLRVEQINGKYCSGNAILTHRNITGMVSLPITIPGMLSLTYYITGTVIKKIKIPVMYSGFKYNTSNENLRV